MAHVPLPVDWQGAQAGGWQRARLCQWSDDRSKPVAGHACTSAGGLARSASRWLAADVILPVFGGTFRPADILHRRERVVGSQCSPASRPSTGTGRRRQHASWRGQWRDGRIKPEANCAGDSTGGGPCMRGSATGLPDQASGCKRQWQRARPGRGSSERVNGLQPLMPLMIIFLFCLWLDSVGI